MSKGCCKDCTERRIGCHSECEQYLEETRQRQARNEKIKKIKDDEHIYFAQLKEEKTRNLRYRQTRGK